MAGGNRTESLNEQVLQAVLSEAFEDHLRVALIQPGSSRYEQIKWQSTLVQKSCETVRSGRVLQQGWNRVLYVPCNCYDCKGLSFYIWKGEKL